MRLLTLALLALPLTSIAGVIDLDDANYWQVQNSSNYETICEGFIDSCDAPNGLYNVINLTTGERQNGVEIKDSAPSDEHGHTHYLVNGTETPIPSGEFDDGGSMSLSCDAGDMAIAVMCNVYSFDTESYEIAHTQISGSSASCSADYGFTPTITMTVSCIKH